jgi:hypothetical protein
MTQDAKYSIVAFLTGGALMILMVCLSLEFQTIDWVKWFGFACAQGLYLAAVAYT